MEWAKAQRKARIARNKIFYLENYDFIGIEAPIKLLISKDLC
jgi:hypothetical protein